MVSELASRYASKTSRRKGSSEECSLAEIDTGRLQLSTTDSVASYEIVLIIVLISHKLYFCEIHTVLDNTVPERTILEKCIKLIEPTTSQRFNEHPNVSYTEDLKV